MLLLSSPLARCGRPEDPTRRGGQRTLGSTDVFGRCGWPTSAFHKRKGTVANPPKPPSRIRPTTVVAGLVNRSRNWTLGITGGIAVQMNHSTRSKRVQRDYCERHSNRFRNHAQVGPNLRRNRRLKKFSSSVADLCCDCPANMSSVSSFCSASSNQSAFMYSKGDWPA